MRLRTFIEKGINRLTSLMPYDDPILSRSEFKINLSDFDELQIAALTSKKARNIVVAGAGSGKTRIITNRVAHLINECHVPLDRIRVITFTRAATEEIVRRLSELTPLPPEDLERCVKTIHRFAIETAKKLNPAIQYKIADFDAPDDPIRKLWESRLREEVLRNPDLKYVLQELFHNANVTESAIEEKYFKQNTYPDPDVGTAKKGLKVRSKMEAKVIGFLIKNKIKFEYEKPVVFSDFAFRPDIYLTDYGIFVEVLGLWNHPDHLHKYRECFRKKKEQLAKYHSWNPCVEIYPDDLDSDEFERKIFGAIRSAKQFTDKPGYEEEMDAIQDIPRIIKNVLSRFNELDQALVNNQMDLYAYASTLKYPFKLIYPLFLKLRNSVLEECHQNHIYYGAHIFDYLRRNLPPDFNKNLDYLFIDEFQDVQPVQMSFLEHFFNRNFYIIGDARQSIYGFLGGSDYFIKNLNHYFSYVNQVSLKYNYRSHQKIVELGNRVKPQFERIFSKKENGEPTIIIKARSEAKQASEIYKWVKNQIQDEPLMVLSRYQKGKIYEAYAEAIKNAGSEDQIMTFHKCKGKEAENVLIVGCNYSDDPDVWETVPSKDRDHPLLKGINNLYQSRDKGMEEINLLYVAITRAKKRLFVACDIKSSAPFIQLIEPHQDLISIINFKYKSNLVRDQKVS